VTTQRCAASLIGLVLTLAAAQGAFAQAQAAAASVDAAAAVAPAASTAGASPARTWSLRLPTVEKVVFRGSVSHDAAGMGTAQMMYPAPNPVGLLAAILTHSLVSTSLRESQKSQMQLEADKVLQPFESVLGTFTNRRLMEEGVRKMAAGGPKRVVAPAVSAGADWLIESAPVFSMTQDRGALVLDNAVRIFGPGSTKAAYAQTVRVVSSPLAPMPVPMPPSPSASAVTAPAEAASAPELTPMWLESDGRRLIESSVELFAESLDVALEQASASALDATAPHRTFRYAEGGSERMERAQLVSERCGRTLIRTLRGWLMSIPTTGETGCRPGS